MKVIFVRHGETSENVAKRHQPEHTPLSINGRKQAVAAGARLQSVGVTHVVASPLVRTLQTASLIADQIDLIPSIDHSLKELIRPASLTGFTHRHYKSLLFYGVWYLGLVRVGESYAQIRDRIATAKQNIERLPDDAVVVVVSHAVFMSLFIAHVCSPRPFSPLGAARTFIRLKKLKNTQMIEYTVATGTGLCGWVHTPGELVEPQSHQKEQVT